MARLFDREYTKRELMQRIGDISQVADARQTVITNGRGQGVKAIDLRTGNGLALTVLTDRGMDIAWAEYKGVPLSHISKCGINSPAFFEPQGLGFFRNFTAGLLTTCGLTYMGAPSFDDGKDLGVHGRISNIPAEDVSVYKEWEGDEFVFKVRGKMRECEYFAENMVLTRTLSFKLGENKIHIKDTVENCGFEPQPLMLLYHFNFGFPLIDKEARLYHTPAQITPRDDSAAQGISEYNSFHEPVHKYAEQVFFYDMQPKNDVSFSCLYNETLAGGLGVSLKYKKSQLKNFTEWKQLGEGDYVVAMEPCTATPIGRSKARKTGILEFISPGETRSFDIELGIVEGRKELDDLINNSQ